MIRLLFPILLLLAGLGIYFTFGKKKVVSVTGTSTTGGTLTTTTGGGTTTTTGGGTTTTTGGGTTTTTGGGTTTTTGATGRIGLTYEGGQAVYNKFNGTSVPLRGIGYLVDGTLLTFDDTEYRDGEYKRIAGSQNSDVSGLIGSFNVDGSSQLVYARRTGVNLMGYFGAVGFLRNGTIVYRQIINEGEYNEYSYYRT